jgi:trehalose/maltose transport system substrate-binding protein
MYIKIRLFILTALCGFTLPLPAAEITISCGAVGQEQELCEEAANTWAQQSGHTVQVTSPPESTNERYFKYLIDLGKGDDSVDVYQIDVIWPTLLAKYFIDLREYIEDPITQKHFPTIIKNNTVNGRLVGMPWYTDVGVLYYRKDLLDKYGFQVPEEWSALADIALYIQTEERKAGNDKLWGYVFQGDAYEGLTCNALEWINSYGAGTVVDSHGDITVNDPRATLAIARAANWVNVIAPQRVTSFHEEDARITFQLGQAVFMRNWPYAWALLNGPDSPVANNVDVAPLPKGGLKGQTVGTLGGWQLAVSKFSKNPQVAADLVRYLTSEAVQKQRAIVGSYAPTIKELYDDPDVIKANAFFAKLRPMLDNAVARPTQQTGEQYMAVSTRFWEAVHRSLLGVDSTHNNLAALQDQLQLIKQRGDW